MSYHSKTRRLVYKVRLFPVDQPEKSDLILKNPLREIKPELGEDLYNRCVSYANATHQVDGQSRDPSWERHLHLVILEVARCNGHRHYSPFQKRRV